MTIDEAFNASVTYYDDWMMKALPNYEDIFNSAMVLLPFEPGSTLKVLDLGAGTGLFSRHILWKYPQAHFVLMDLAEKMLEVARERFRNHPTQFKYLLEDYRKLDGSQEYDLVISSLSIHHIAVPSMVLWQFGRIHRLLRKGGIFINIDQIRGGTPYLRELYWNHWLKQVQESGAPEEHIRESIDRRKTYDRDALLEDQLEWLKSSGFQNVDCVYKNFFVGVFLGMKA